MHIKAEELWNNRFKENEVSREKSVPDKQTRKEAENQPITAELVEKSDRTVLRNQEQLTIKNIFASSFEPANSSPMVSRSDSEMCKASTTEFVDKPPLKTPMSYSINQVEILRKLENY